MSGGETVEVVELTGRRVFLDQEDQFGSLEHTGSFWRRASLPRRDRSQDDSIMELVSPFQILTLIVAPAVLTNSSSVLSLSTSNRFARAVDRSRALYDKLKDPEGLTASEVDIFTRQLPIIRQRGLLLVRAMTAFYTSVGAFSATALTSLIGAGTEMYGQALASHLLTMLAVTMGCVGVLGLVSGTTMLVRETWVAFKFLEMETHIGEELPRM